MVVPLTCQTSPSLSEPLCLLPWSYPRSLSLGLISLLTGALPLVPLGQPSHYARRFSLTWKTYHAILLLIILLCLLMKLNSSIWHKMLFTPWILPKSSSLSPIFILHSILWFHISQIYHASVYQSLIIGRPTSWLLPYSCTTCIIFCILFF